MEIYFVVKNVFENASHINCKSNIQFLLIL